MIVAVVALIVAMGGTSYAAITLPRNSVGPRQIRAGAVGSTELRDRSLRVRDLTRRARAAPRGPQGPPGPAGPPGTAAARGAAGPRPDTAKHAARSARAPPARA